MGDFQSILLVEEVINTIIGAGADILINNQIHRSLPKYSTFLIMQQLKSFSSALCLSHDTHQNEQSEEDQEPISQRIDTWQTCHAKFIFKPQSLQPSSLLSFYKSTKSRGNTVVINQPQPQPYRMKIEAELDPDIEKIRALKKLRLMEQKKVQLRALSIQNEHEAQSKKMLDIRDSLKGIPHTFDYEGNAILLRKNNDINLSLDVQTEIHITPSNISFGVKEVTQSENPDDYLLKDAMRQLRVAGLSMKRSKKMSSEIQEYLKDQFGGQRKILQPKILFSKTAEQKQRRSIKQESVKQESSNVLPLMVLKPGVRLITLEDDNLSVDKQSEQKQKSFDTLTKPEYERLLLQNSLALNYASQFHNTVRTVKNSSQQRRTGTNTFKQERIQSQIFFQTSYKQYSTLKVIIHSRCHRHRGAGKYQEIMESQKSKFQQSLEPIF